MQRINDNLIKHILLGIITFAWISGLIIAGSDNISMPWINLAGLGLFIGASILMGKVLHLKNSDAPEMKHPIPNRIHEKQVSWQYPGNRKVRYAMGVLIKT